MSEASEQEDLERNCREILGKNPGDPAGLNLVAILARRQGRIDDALRITAHAIRLHPHIAEFHANLGEFSRHANLMDQSISAFERAIQLKPEEPTFHNGLGTVLAENRMYEKAVARYRRAIELKPDYADAWNNLGGTLRELDRLSEAESAIGRAIQIEPNLASAHSNLAIVLMDQQRFIEAIESFHRAIAARPDYREAHHNLGMLHLLLGDFQRGWEEYQWRPITPLQIRQPTWRGEDLRGKTIFLHAEQGIGDTIQFARFIPILQEKGAHVLIGCHPELSGLVGGLAQIVHRGDRFPPFDFYCPLLNVPMVLGTNVNNIPARIPYLKADEERSKLWRERLGPRKGNLRVGLAWAGSPKHADDARRSIALEKFAPVLANPNIEFISLQVGPAGARAAQHGMVDFTSELRDFSDTAALVDQLDLVVTVDTAVAHLAGAMAKPTWVLLAKTPDWRWLLGRADSPWYPGLRLFRQERRGDWDAVIEAIAQKLPEFSHAPL